MYIAVHTCDPPPPLPLPSPPLPTHCLCRSVRLCVSACLPVCLSLALCVFISVSVSLSLSASLSVSLSLCLSVSVSQSVYLSVFLSACLSVRCDVVYHTLQVNKKIQLNMRHWPGVQSNCALVSVRRRSTPIEMQHNAAVHWDEMNTLRRKSG